MSRAHSRGIKRLGLFLGLGNEDFRAVLEVSRTERPAHAIQIGESVPEAVASFLVLLRILDEVVPEMGRERIPAVGFLLQNVLHLRRRFGFLGKFERGSVAEHMLVEADDCRPARGAAAPTERRR